MKSFLKLMLAIVPVLLVAACGGGDDSLDDRLDLADPKVRLVHAIPGAPNVTLFRNDLNVSAEVTNVAYKGASRYFDVSTATERWDVRTATSPSSTVGSVTLDARRGNKYTLVAVPDTGSLSSVVLIDDPYNKSISSDNARVRVFNAAFNAGGLDVYLTSPTADISALAPTFGAIAYKNAVPASGSDSQDLEGGTYRIRVTAAGTKTVIFDATVDLAKNADWLLTTVPDGLTASDIGVLVVKSDEGAPATELTNTL